MLAVRAGQAALNNKGNLTWHCLNISVMTLGSWRQIKGSSRTNGKGGKELSNKAAIIQSNVDIEVYFALLRAVSIMNLLSEMWEGTHPSWVIL